jgi:hypothetical protein
MIHLDTNFLIASLRPQTPESERVSIWLGEGAVVRLSVIFGRSFFAGL